MGTPKFKIGDRVRIAQSADAKNRQFIGEVFTIDVDEGVNGGEQAWSGKPCKSPYVLKESELELAQSPVRAITRKEVVPGQYGSVSIKEPHPRYERSVNVCVQPTHLSADELRATAATFLELADALESEPTP